MQNNGLLLQMLRRKPQGSQTPEIVGEDSAAQSDVSSSTCSVLLHCSTLLMNSLIDTVSFNMAPIFFQFHELQRSPPSARFLPGDFAEKRTLEQGVASGCGSPLSLRENHEKGSPDCGKKKVTFDVNIKTYDAVVSDESVNVVNGATTEETEFPKAGDKLIPNLSTFPLNHRYQNCDILDDDDDDDDIGYEDEDCDSDEHDYLSGIEEGEEESYDSFFRQLVTKGQENFHDASCSEMMRTSFTCRQPTISVKSHVHDSRQCANSVLNSIENISMNKKFEVRADPIKNPGKENFNLGPVVMVKKPQMLIKAPNLSTKQEISFDASLSNWLVSSDNSTFEGPQESHSHHSLTLH